MYLLMFNFIGYTAFLVEVIASFVIKKHKYLNKVKENHNVR